MRLVAEVERGLTAGQIAGVVTAVAGGRATRRRLAQSLKDNPQVLRTGRPPAILATARLLLALRTAGAAGVSAPRCGGCMRELRYVRSRAVATGAAAGAWSGSVPARAAANCGERSPLDRHGRHRCQNCPDTDGDPLEELAQLVTALDPGLSRETIAATLQQATSRPAGQRRLAWAIAARPDLLTGAGACAPPRRCCGSSTGSSRRVPPRSSSRPARAAPG